MPTATNYKLLEIERSALSAAVVYMTRVCMGSTLCYSEQPLPGGLAPPRRWYPYAAQTEDTYALDAIPARVGQCRRRPRCGDVRRLAAAAGQRPGRTGWRAVGPYRGGRP